MLKKVIHSLFLCGALVGSCLAQAPDSVSGAFYSDNKRGEAPGVDPSVKVLLHADGSYSSLLSNFSGGVYKYARTSSNTATLTLGGESYLLTFGDGNTGTVSVLASTFAPGAGGTFRLGFLDDLKQLTAVSNRAACTSTKAAFTGFIIGGTSPRTVLIRGAGPSLPADSVPGKCLDPKIAVYDSSGALKISNDDWGADVAIPEIGLVTAAAYSEIFAYLGLMPFEADSKDAALLVTLEPGAYTVQTYAASGHDGEVVTEAYLMP